MITEQRAQLDATFDRLTRAAEAVSANLLELEAQPAFQALEHATLTGTTGERCARTRDAVAELWRRYTQLTALLDDAGAHRHDEAELRRLLTGPSIEFARQQQPLAQRDLHTFGQRVTCCTPDDLLATMTAAFHGAQVTVAEVGAVWDGLVPKVASARGRLQTISDRSREAVELGASLDRLAEQVLSDPLAVDAGEVDALATQVERFVAALESFADDLAHARVALDGLRRAELAGAETARLLHAKIVVDPGFATPCRAYAEFDRRFAALDYDSIVTWTDELAPAQAEWTRFIATCRAMLDRRGELRGRLDAYRAMTFATGRAEDVAADDAYAAAHDALYRAPADLDRAEQLVREYQALSTPTDDGVQR